MRELLLLLMLAVGSVQAQTPASFAGLMGEGQKLAAEGRHNDALIAFHGAYGRASNAQQVALSAWKVGEMHAKLGDEEAALQWYRLSLAQFRFKEVEEAMRDLEKARWSRPVTAQQIKAALLPPSQKGPQVEPNGIDLEVLFNYNEATLTQEGRATVRTLADALREPGLQQRSVRIIGHTDARGADAYNLRLSEQRAQAVRDQLIQTYRLDANRLEAVGRGKSQLKYRGDTEDDHRLNRRVEVQLTQ